MKSLITITICLTTTALLHAQSPIFVTPTGTGNGTSWNDACNLEEAIAVIERSRASAPLSDQASLNDPASPLPKTEIWVQKGTYYPSKMLDIPDSVKIYGGFAGTEDDLSQRNFSANPTIIDGQEKIGSIFRLENFAEINGFAIRNGNANGHSHKNGGGVWADENCVITNCVITNNTAALNGGGVYAKGKVKIVNSTIENNIAGSGSGNDLFGNCTSIVGIQISAGATIAGCRENTPDFGEISFKSNDIWVISGGDIRQEWSDAVLAEGCNKTWYHGGSVGSFYADCRANSDRSSYGDLFSWCAVTRFGHLLCPAPWRVPTVQDFVNLDIALGGTGDNRTGDSPAGIHSKYFSTSGTFGQFWSGRAGGRDQGNGSLEYQGQEMDYWTQTSFDETHAHRLFISTDAKIWPQHKDTKAFAMTLRCVR